MILLESQTISITNFDQIRQKQDTPSYFRIYNISMNTVYTLFNREGIFIFKGVTDNQTEQLSPLYQNQNREKIINCLIHLCRHFNERDSIVHNTQSGQGAQRVYRKDAAVLPGFNIDN